MNARAAQFAQRRTALQLQCAQQREQLAHSVGEMQHSLQSLNKGLGMLRATRLLPMLLAAVSAAGVVSRAGGVIRVLGRVWLVVQTFKRLRQSLR
jgi:hypothetical protein